MSWPLPANVEFVVVIASETLYMVIPIFTSPHGGVRWGNPHPTPVRSKTFHQAVIPRQRKERVSDRKILAYGKPRVSRHNHR